MSETAELLARAIGAGYEVGELIGRGGFGEVYAASDRSLNRTVAIKVLRADIADSRTAVDRFRREAQALARLRHPHIMPVYGIGEGEGITYFVMPRIEGESLAQLMERGERLPLAEACRVIAEAADALAAAHRAGVVHRDIKPDNILLEGPERHALLMDFGIAKSGGADARLTGTGMIIGTPFYMSPEQATGDHTGPASDIYSFGVVSYELLAGRPLFAQATSPQHVITAHIAQAPEELRAVNPEIPAAIARAVMKCLKKEPSERWAAVEDFARAFNQARADLPRDPEVVIPEAPPPLSRRASVAVAAAGALGLALCFAIYQRFGTPQLDSPRLSREAALADAERAADSLGVPRYRERAWTFDGDGDHARFLGRGPVPDSASLRRVALGTWRFAFYTSGTRGHARLTVGGPGWVSGFERQIDTTAPRPAPTQVDPARQRAVLGALGWNPDSLRLVDSSRSTVDRREVRTWAWEPVRPNPALAIAGDTATQRIEATFTDGELTRYRSRTILPAAEVARDQKRSSVQTPVIVTMCILLLLGVGFDLVRARRDRALRLERALRLGIATAVLFALVMSTVSRPATPFSFDFHPERSNLAAELGQLALFLMLIAPFLFLIATGLAAACETIALRRAPGVLAGYQVLTTTPGLRRLARFLPAGAALGFAVGGAAALGAFVAARLSGSPFIVDQSWTQPLPKSLAQLGITAGFAPLAVLLAAWVLLHARAIGHGAAEALGAFFVAAAASAFAFTVGNAAPDIATYAVCAGGLALIIGRRGVVEAMVAFVAMVLLTGVATAWRAPFSDPWPPTIALAVLAASAVAAAFLPRPVSVAPSPSGTPRPMPPGYSPAARTAPAGTPAT